MSQAPETERPSAPDQQEPGPKRPGLVMTVLTLLAVLALVGVLVVAVTYDPDVDSRTGRLDAGTGDGATAAPAAPGAPRDKDDTVAPTESTALDPANRTDSEAAVRGHWPLIGHDEFDGNTLDRRLWSPYTGQTTGGVGRHKAENLSVADGRLTITSRGKTSGGLAWRQGQRYGRWEVRAKTNRGSGYGDVILLWPDAEDWPEGGEINFMEVPKGPRAQSHMIVHYGEDNSQVGKSINGDFTQWHNYAVEWAPDHVAGFIDGQEVFRTTDRKVVPPRPMHLAMQQDIGPYGDDWIPALDSSSPAKLDFQIDWVRIYGLG